MRNIPKHYKLRCTEAKMGKGAVNFEKNDEYYTPKQIVKMFSEGFEYDPATTPGKAEDLGIPNFDTIETDGLKADWTQYRNIWCNPPFTIKHEFLKKAQDYYDRTGGVYICSYLSSF